MACKDQKPTQAPLRKVGFILKMLKIISTSLYLKWTSWLLENSQVVSLSPSFFVRAGGIFHLKKIFFDKGSEAIYLFVCFPTIVTLFLEEARRNGEHSTPLHLITKTASQSLVSDMCSLHSSPSSLDFSTQLLPCGYHILYKVGLRPKSIRLSSCFL